MSKPVESGYGGRLSKLRDLVMVIGTLVGLIAFFIALGGIVADWFFMEKATPIGDFFHF